jgi:hypothetical protein
MSDNSDTTDDGSDTSLFGNLTNKLKYKIHKAAYDPNANKFAEEQAKKKKEEEEKKKEKKDDNTTTDNTKDGEPPSDPHKFNAKRLAKKVGNQTLDILKKIFYPFLAIMLAMIVTNELIIYAVPIRIVFFIFTLVLCIYSHTTAISLSLYYIFKGAYSYYVNNMTDRPKKDIMPTIFALLPITTYKPMSSFSAFFMYPFTYPKTEKAALKLPDVMKGYWESLVESFKDFDKVKNLPLFVEDVKNIQYDLTHLHDLSGPAINFKEPAKSVNANLAQNAQYSKGAREMLNKGQASPPTVNNSNPTPPVPSAPAAQPAVVNENNNPK